MPNIFHFEVSSDHGNTFVPGCLVKKDADGFAQWYDGNADFTGGVTLLGVCVGYLAPPSGLTDPLLKVPVVTDLHNTIWEIQASFTDGDVTAAGRNGSGLIGKHVIPLDFLNSDITANSLLRKMSPMRVELAGDDAGPFVIRGLVRDKDNEILANPRILVQFVNNEVTGLAFYSIEDND
jgi:hypothetical protein